MRTSPFDPEMSDSSQNRDIVALKKGLTFQFGLQKGSKPDGRDAKRLGSYVDGPRLARIGSGSMLGSLALICPACFRVLRPLAKMGFADSEIQTRERHFLPVNRAECLT